jgi:hypothetical protein
VGNITGISRFLLLRTVKMNPERLLLVRGVGRHLLMEAMSECNVKSHSVVWTSHRLYQQRDYGLDVRVKSPTVLDDLVLEFGQQCWKSGPSLSFKNSGKAMPGSWKSLHCSIGQALVTGPVAHRFGLRSEVCPTLHPLPRSQWALVNTNNDYILIFLFLVDLNFEVTHLLQDTLVASKFG